MTTELQLQLPIGIVKLGGQKAHFNINYRAGLDIRMSTSRNKIERNCVQAEDRGLGASPSGWTSSNQAGFLFRNFVAGGT